MGGTHEENAVGSQNSAGVDLLELHLLRTRPYQPPGPWAPSPSIVLLGPPRTGARRARVTGSAVPSSPRLRVPGWPQATDPAGTRCTAARRCSGPHLGSSTDPN